MSPQEVKPARFLCTKCGHTTEGPNTSECVLCKGCQEYMAVKLTKVRAEGLVTIMNTLFIVDGDRRPDTLFEVSCTTDATGTPTWTLHRGGQTLAEGTVDECFEQFMEKWPELGDEWQKDAGPAVPLTPAQAAREAVEPYDDEYPLDVEWEAVIANAIHKDRAHRLPRATTVRALSYAWIRKAALDVVAKLKRGSCWCGAGTGDPNLAGRHTAACAAAQEFVNTYGKDCAHEPAELQDALDDIYEQARRTAEHEAQPFYDSYKAFRKRWDKQALPFDDQLACIALEMLVNHDSSGEGLAATLQSIRDRSEDEALKTFITDLFRGGLQVLNSPKCSEGGLELEQMLAVYLPPVKATQVALMAIEYGRRAERTRIEQAIKDIAKEPL